MLQQTLMRTALALALALPLAATAQTAAEIQQREAAADLVMSQAAALGIIRWECRDLLARSADDVERAALAWWQRHRDELDAANWIVLMALERYKATMTPEAAAEAQRQTLVATVSGSMALLRAVFKRELPTADSCRQAVRQFDDSEGGARAFKTVPGFERLAEFQDALRRTHRAPGFQLPEEKARSFDAQVSATEDPVVSLDAIESARERGDARVMMRGYEALANRGDGNAAQSLGLIHLQGALGQQKNPANAYRWFYRGWTAGDAESLHALGVMWRDGIGMSANFKVALAAFLIARFMAGESEPVGVRATANIQRLQQAMPVQDVAEVACASWVALHGAIRGVINPPLTGPAANQFPQLLTGNLRQAFGIGPPNLVCQ